MKAKPQIFLSYARQDEEKVNQLYQKLSDAGFRPWMDRKDIDPGERWQFSIRKAIRHSDFFLMCLSRNSVDKKGFFQAEIRYALDIAQEKSDNEVFLIPIRLENCDVPRKLGAFQWVDLFEENGWIQLVQALQARKEHRSNATSVIFSRLHPLLNRWTTVIAVAIVIIGLVGYLRLFHSEESVTIKPTEQSTPTDTTAIKSPPPVVPDSQKVRLPVDRSMAETLVLIERPPFEGGDFYLGKYEVTNQEYMEFVRKTGHRSPFYAQDSRFNQPDQPIVGISWDDAVAYCRWLSQTTGKSHALPTEDEWKLAAFGTEQREYPWGEVSPSGLYANYDNLTGRPAPVKDYPQGVTPDSIFNMGGNVWEWCNGWFDFAKTERVIRGGSWNAAPDNMRLAFRGGEKQDERSRSDVGFRVVRSLD